MQVSSSGGAQAADYLKQMRERMFSRADKDGSGGLSLDEFAAMGKGRRAREAADCAGSAAGIAATDRAQRIVSTPDTKGDGSPGQDAMAAGRPLPDGGPNGSLSPGTLSALLSVQEGSGKAQGAANGAAKLFSKLDADGDGTLSAAEFAAGARARGAHHGHHHHGPQALAHSQSAQGAATGAAAAKALQGYLQASGGQASGSLLQAAA